MKTGILTSAALVAGLYSATLFARSPLWNEPEEPATLPEVLADRANIDAVRKSGFADYDIDLLHTNIAKLMKGLLEESVPRGPGSFMEMTEHATTRRMIRGTDSAGKEFFRIRLRFGTALTTSIYPDLYSYRVDCFLYPASEGRLEKVIFQFYRINHSGVEYRREIRRIVHPAPGHMAGEAVAAAGQPQPSDGPASNDGLTIEYYSRPASQKAIWEEGDGATAAQLSMPPDTLFQLNDPQMPVPFGRQVAVVRKYRQLLRVVEASLEGRLRDQELVKALVLEKVLDF